MKTNVNQENELNKNVNYVFLKQEDGGVKASGDVRWSAKFILLQLKEYADKGIDVNEYQYLYWKTLIGYWEFWKTQDDFNGVRKKQFNQYLNPDEQKLFNFSEKIVRKINNYKELDNKLFSSELAKDCWEIL